MIVATVAVCCGLLVALGLLTGQHPGSVRWLGPTVLAVAGLLFYSMTVRVGDGWLRWSFGPGIIRKKVPLSEIASVEPVQNSWVCGWGIHYTPGGWLYNVSGFRAVQFVLKNGKRFRLGTAEPLQLIAAVHAEIENLPK